MIQLPEKLTYGITGAAGGLVGLVAAGGSCSSGCSACGSCAGLGLLLPLLALVLGKRNMSHERPATAATGDIRID